MNCRKCGENFKVRQWVDGKRRNLQNRKHCYKCVPFKSVHGKPETTRRSADGLLWRCSRCRLWLPLTDYKKHTGRDLPRSFCKNCVRAYDREFYNKHAKRKSGRKNSLGRIRRKKIKDFIDSLKARPCEDCGIQHPAWAMDFDHRDPSEKLFSIGDCFRHPMADVLIEIKKCDLLCCLCHRYRTHGFVRRKSDGSTVPMPAEELLVRGTIRHR